jgi:hypothetical protein
MKNKKEPKPRTAKPASEPALDNANMGNITSKAELEAFLLNIRDKMDEEVASPIYALTGMNYIMSLPGVYDWLDDETKEIARDIWLRLKQAGFQLRNPPMLFGDAEEGNGGRG